MNEGHWNTAGEPGLATVTHRMSRISWVKVTCIACITDGMFRGTLDKQVETLEYVFPLRVVVKLTTLSFCMLRKVLLQSHRICEGGEIFETLDRKGK